MSIHLEGKSSPDFGWSGWCQRPWRQVVVALSGGELIYFELDATGQLMVGRCRLTLSNPR